MDYNNHGHLRARNADLPAALATLPAVDNLWGFVIAAAGGDTQHMPPVLGFHTSFNSDVLAVYLVTDRVFGLFEMSSSGQSFTLTIALPRVRRVARMDDSQFTRLVIEIEADRFTSTASVDEQGRSQGQIVPAGYEIVESDAAGRESLRQFQVAISAALGL